MVASSRLLAAASALALSSVAAAAVLRRQQEQEDGNNNNKWLATNYTWGCSPGGCIANFLLMGFADSPAAGAPAFDVECSPVYLQQDWVACKNTADGSEMAPESVVYAVWQKTAAYGDPNQYINIAHVYYRREDGLYWIAQTNTTSFVPEQGSSDFFDIATVLPAPESHLPPPTHVASTTTTTTHAPAVEPDQENQQTGGGDGDNNDDEDDDEDVPPVTGTGSDVAASDPVSPAGENIPLPSDGGADSTTSSEETDEPTPVVNAPVATETDEPSAPAESDDTTVSTETSEDTPVTDESDPEASDVVLSQPLLNNTRTPDTPSIGRIPEGGDGA